MRELDDLLAGLDVSAVTSTKYRAVTDWLAERLQLPTASIRCKAIQSDKNAANRLREAASRLDLLLLLVEGTVDLKTVLERTNDVVVPNGLIRAALVRVSGTSPTYMLLTADESFASKLQNIAADLERVPLKGSSGASLPVPETAWATTGPVSIPTDLFDERSLARPDASKLHDLRDWLANRSHVPPTSVVVKAVVDLKNAGNRISEALGLHPALLALVLTDSQERGRIAGLLGRRLADLPNRPVVGFITRTSGDRWIFELLDEPMSTTASESSGPPYVAQSGSSDDLKVNAHVARLYRHLPLGPNARELYEELRDSSDRDRQSISTRAGTFVEDLIKKDGVSLVILTGDAGHGKTHLCTSLLVAACNMSSTAALEAMREDPRGQRRFERGDVRPLRIVKDLSHVEPVSDAAAMLLDILEDKTSIGIVCANEGRLRAVIDQLPDRLAVVRQALDATVNEGTTSVEEAVQVVNLNYQSVTSGDPSFFAQLLQKWVDDGRSWTVCRSCAAHPKCPIYANRQFFAAEGPHGSLPSRRLHTLVQIVEQSGYVLTIREALMFLAYTLIGSDTCESVHARFRRNKLTGGVTSLSLLFEPELQAQEVDQLRILERLHRLDPGAVALREVDDELLRELDATGPGVTAELSSGPPRTRREAKDHQAQTRTKVKEARRDAYFVDSKNAIPPWRRVGLTSYDLFEAIAAGRKLDANATKSIRNRLVHGLHVVQGIRPQTDADLYLVDPAFAQSRGGTSVIAARVSVRNVELLPQSGYWRLHAKSPRVSVVESVDWLDRRIVVKLGPQRDDAFPLDLRQFEFLLRAAGGVAFRAFHGADMRRLSARLAMVLRGRSLELDRITVMEGHAPRSISIDVDNTFAVGEM